MAKKETQKRIDRAERDNFPGYPLYPAEEDVYSQLKEEIELDPEDPSHLKVLIEPLPH